MTIIDIIRFAEEHPNNKWFVNEMKLGHVSYHLFNNISVDGCTVDHNNRLVAILENRGVGRIIKDSLHYRDGYSNYFTNTGMIIVIDGETIVTVFPARREQLLQRNYNFFRTHKEALVLLTRADENQTWNPGYIAH